MPGQLVFLGGASLVLEICTGIRRFILIINGLQAARAKCSSGVAQIPREIDYEIRVVIAQLVQE